jgi:hypothetical protein
MKTPEICALVAVSLYGIYQLATGLSSGELTIKRKTARRDEEPHFFWLFVIFWVFILGCVGKAALHGFPLTGR